MSKSTKDQGEKPTGDEAVQPAVVPTPDAADAANEAQQDAQGAAPASAWEPHEEIPQGGGSYVRQPDGSLVKTTQEEDD